MKLNLKMIAAAAALATVGSANAAFVAPNTANSGSTFALLAFNTATRAYYIRDLGYVLNTFMPDSVTTLATDGTGGVATTGNKTPAAGLTLDTSNAPNFIDPAFGSWVSGQNLADIRWVAAATDSLSAAASGVSRFITSSAAAQTGFTNGQVTNYVGGANAGGLSTLFGAATTLSITGTALGTWADTNGGLGATTLSTLGQSAGLYYAARSAATGPTATAATVTQFGNGGGFATVTLAANGDFTYALAPAITSAVPVPGSVWLMGAGLGAMGAFMRRRKV